MIQNRRRYVFLNSTALTSILFSSFNFRITYVSGMRRGYTIRSVKKNPYVVRIIIDQIIYCNILQLYFTTYEPLWSKALQ